MEGTEVERPDDTTAKKSEEVGDGESKTGGAEETSNSDESKDPAESTTEDATAENEIPQEVQFAKMGKKKVKQHQPVRPPLGLVVGVAGAGKSTLASCILGKREYRSMFKVGSKTTEPQMVKWNGLVVLDSPGLPDPFPASSDAYYDATVRKLREAGYINVLIFVVNHDRITPTLIRNYGILYRAFNKLSCVKVFVLRRESSFLSLGIADQDRIAADGKDTVNKIMEASRLKKWRARQFFILTSGTGEEQDRQINKIREQVRISPVTLISEKEGLRTTEETKLLSKGADEDGKRNSARDFEESLAEPPKWPGLGGGKSEAKEREARMAKLTKLRKQEEQKAAKVKLAKEKQAKKAKGKQPKDPVSGGADGKKDGKSGCTVM